MAGPRDVLSRVLAAVEADFLDAGVEALGPERRRRRVGQGWACVGLAEATAAGMPTVNPLTSEHPVLLTGAEADAGTPATSQTTRAAPTAIGSPMNEEKRRVVLSDEDRRFLDQVVAKTLAQPNRHPIGVLHALRIGLEVVRHSLTSPQSALNFLNTPVAEVRFQIRWHGQFDQPNLLHQAELARVLEQEYESRSQAVDAIINYAEWLARTTALRQLTAEATYRVARRAHLRHPRSPVGHGSACAGTRIRRHRVRPIPTGFPDAVHRVRPPAGLGCTPLARGRGGAPPLGDGGCG